MGFTRVDNWLFDIVMPGTSPNAFKVVSAVVRLTVGWQREEAHITFDQFHEVTGIVGRGTLNNAISEAVQKGFIARSGSTKTILYSIEIVPTPEDEIVLKSYQNQYQNGTKDSTKIVPSTIYKEKKERKENIYTHELAADAVPFPEQNEEQQEMISALSREVKETFALGLTADNFENAADGLLTKGIRPDQVRGFCDWWKDNGHYRGKPALKSLVQEIDNFTAGVKHSTNGHYNGPTFDEIVRSAFDEDIIKR